MATATANSFQLVDLPDEILLMIMRKLDYETLLDAVYVNKHFRELAEPFIYESITVLHGEKALNLSHSFMKNTSRPNWVRSLLVSTKFGQETNLMKLAPFICLMDNIQDLRLETPDCNNKKPDDRELWVELQDSYERMFKQSSVLIPDRRNRLLPNLKSCVVHFVDTHTELYSMTRYSSIFLHPTLESLTISCMSTDFPGAIFKDIHDIGLLKGSTALEYLHLEECDLHPPSLEIILSFPRALKSLKISEGIRYDGIFRAGSSRMHGNVKPEQISQSIVDTCKDSLESLSLALGYTRVRGQSINHKGQHLKLNQLTKLKHLEVNNRTLNLIRDRPECDHNTWKRLPPSLESFKVFAVPLLPPQQDTRRPYVPLQPCIFKEKDHHGIPNLKKLTYSYEHYESTDDDEMNFNDLLMNIVYNQANGDPPIAAGDFDPNPAPGNPILNLLQQAVGAANNHPPPPAPIPNPANTAFMAAPIYANLDAPPQNTQPPRFRWRTSNNPTQRRYSRPELSRSDTAKLGLLQTIHDSILAPCTQTQTRLQIDIVTLSRGFIPPYLFPEEMPKTHEAWFDSANPMKPDEFVERIRRSRRDAMRVQMSRGSRTSSNWQRAADHDAYDSERERSRNRFMRRLREEELGNELVPDLEDVEIPPEIAIPNGIVPHGDAESSTDDDDDDSEMDVEDVLETLVAEARAAEAEDMDVNMRRSRASTSESDTESDSEYETESGSESESESESESGSGSGSVYVDASTEVIMSDADADEWESIDEDDDENQSRGPSRLPRSMSGIWQLSR